MRSALLVLALALSGCLDDGVVGYKGADDEPRDAAADPPPAEPADTGAPVMETDPGCEQLPDGGCLQCEEDEDCAQGECEDERCVLDEEEEDENVDPSDGDNSGPGGGDP